MCVHVFFVEKVKGVLVFVFLGVKTVTYVGVRACVWAPAVGSRAAVLPLLTRVWQQWQKA